MKKIILTITAIAASLIFVNNASAYVNGPYLGGALGWGDVQQSGFSNLNNKSSKSGIAGRVFAGYKLNDYLALESGFTKFSNVTASGSDPYLGLTSSGTVKSYAIDLIAKAMMPLRYGLGLFATLGGAYLSQQANVNSTAALPRGNSSQTTIQDTVAPTFGLGASYAINNNLVADLAWSRIQVTSNSENGNTDFVGVNLSYHFG